ncbi:MAG TPA: TonB C-terminal domain-containing protein [Gemmatimonadales bacterium]|nr:TonB C-terminal domain-containing protein [Gemmatimonadales bacterium]
MKLHAAVAREHPGRAAGVIGTAVVHAAMAGGLLLAAQRPAVKPMPPAYAVELVAAPAPDPQLKRAPPQAIPTPPPEEKPAPLKPPEKVKPVPPKPEPKPPPRPETEKKEPPAKTRAPEPPLPGETPSTGTDVATVKTPGLEFAYPEYLRNIVAQVYRRWDRPSGSAALRATVSFLILRDGSVREIRFTESSGNFAFDLNCQGAIEAAGNANAFGPLPEGYPADVLPVSFYFTPRVQ